jgi:hypothetical protein
MNLKYPQMLLKYLKYHLNHFDLKSVMYQRFQL